MRAAKEGFYVRCNSSARTHRKTRPYEIGEGLRRGLAIGAEVTRDSEPTIRVNGGLEASSLRVAATGTAEVHERVASRDIGAWGFIGKRRDCSEKHQYGQPSCFLHRYSPMKGVST